ncbi:3-deoxy-D-manno-octulosonic acid transferase [Flavobacteriales bacterium 34_180_T64]|nr:3-deoxy-D-manno-octulosonic acid transferase [Flavobacteriales bacterium 34_180_T64]
MVLYDLSIYLVSFHLKIIGLFNHKLKLGVEGRSKTFEILSKSINSEDKVIWFHCASLGEYEQGLPVFKALRKTNSKHKIVLSFFSPSGYEIRKNTKVADIVVYLPFDTKKNARRFLDIVNPELTIFVKYDIWPNFLNELKSRNLKAYLISAAFRKNQVYFKSYGKKLRKALSAFEHIFVQNEQSKTLLESIDLTQVTVSGDTRYDRVSDQLNQDNNLDFISEFKQDKLCIVIGSSWPEDDELIIEYINNHVNLDVKYIIAPHNIKNNQIEYLSSKIKLPSVRFTQKDQKELSTYSVFIIDTIGLLSKIYSYGDIAYVGGAMGTTGLHNILEPAVFGIPILIGNHYDKFPEAFQMIDNAGVKSVNNSETLDFELSNIITNSELRLKLGELNSNFIKKNTGALIQILNSIRI